MEELDYLTGKETKVVAPASQRCAFVSIVIPTLNEAHSIKRQAHALSQFPQAEIIFADGGSSDGTCLEIQACAETTSNIHFIRSPRGRACQMNAAAKLAQGEWLIFLHADTELPQSSFLFFLEITRNGALFRSGAFRFKLAHKKWIYRYLEVYVGLRCRLFRMSFGDQAIFVKRSLFEEIGGYRDDFPLMEDMELVQRLNKLPGFTVLKMPVYTSARRFEADGYLRRTCGNLYLQVLYKLGVHPKKLAQRYFKDSECCLLS